MCGIAGLYSFDPRPDRLQIHKTVERMTQALRARGPDGGDVWQDPDCPLVLGHRRLSVIDLTDAGKQPMESPSGRFMITFNGEIYNFRDIRKELELSSDIKLAGESDTEVLLCALEQWGLEKTLQRIKGMFAFALWDRKARALHFARDRFGKKPLYVGWAGSNLVFGSELKALCAHPEFSRDVNRDALASYMRFGYVPAPLSMFARVVQVLPGTHISIDLGLLRAGQDLLPLMEYYWNPRDVVIGARENPIEKNNDAVVTEFESILSHSVQERMVSDVPLGAFLSGGIDSSTIVAMMQKDVSVPVKTYSIGFSESGYNEAEYAKEIAAHLGTEHHELYVSARDALDIVPHLPEIYDEPFADSSAIPTFMVSRFARESVTVALSGDGGDEMLGGYNRHITGPKAWKMVNNIPAFMRKDFSAMIRSVSPSTWDKMRRNRPQFGAHMHKFSEILEKHFEGDVYLSLVSNWQKPKSLVMDGGEINIPLVDPDMQVEGLGFSEAMMYWDALSYLNGDILTKVDRASMAVGLEARAPLLDQRIFDYVWRLPLDMKIREGQGKWLLRQVLNKHVPEEMYNRPKQGFSVPIAAWLRGDLKDWAEDLLDEHELKAQGLLNYVQVREAWEEHQKGRGHHAGKLWCVLMFQAWHREWICR